MFFGAAATVVVVVATSFTDESVDAIDHALRSALPRDATVTVRRALPTDDDRTLRTLADVSRATLVGLVSADGVEGATLHFTLEGDPHWSDRQIGFDARDAPSERGRTIGFALASIVPEEPPAAPALPPAPAAPASPPPLVPSRAEAQAREPDAHDTSPSVDMVGLVATGLGGYGGGGGGALAGRFAIGRGFRVRLALGARAGEVAPAQASSQTYFGAAGIGWQPWVNRERSLSVGVRADLMALGEELAHLDADDPKPDRRLRVVPGVDFALEGTWRFARDAALIGAAGAEIAIGETDVFVKAHQVATLVPVHAIAELGLRVTF